MAIEGLEPTISGQHALHLQLAVGIGFWGRATALRNSLLHISRARSKNDRKKNRFREVERNTERDYRK